MTKQKVVFLGMPSHDARLHYSVASQFFQPTKKHNVYRHFSQSSLLAWGFNQLYATALNMREEHDIKWFVMLHSDVVPEPMWMDKIIDIAEANEADLLSVVMPFKDNSGITSTAIADPSNAFTPYTRLTLKQVLDKNFPETFDMEIAHVALTMGIDKQLRLPGLPLYHLHVNTGCMAMRIDREWSQELFFNISDRIVFNNGKYMPVVLSEDWALSSMVADCGGKVMATKAIKAQHIGTANYSNQALWGHDIDPMCPDFMFNMKIQPS